MIRQGLRLGVVLAAMAAVACGKGANELSEVQTATIGPSGGTITVSTANSSALQGTSLTIPPNALSADTTISVSISTQTLDPANADAIGPVVDFEPSGTTFAVPVTLTLPVSTTLSATDQSEVFIEAMEADGTTSVVSATYDGSSNLLTGQISGFTSFGGFKHHLPDGGSSSTSTTTTASSGGTAPDGGVVGGSTGGHGSSGGGTGDAGVGSSGGTAPDAGSVGGTSGNGGASSGGNGDAGFAVADAGVPECVSDKDCGSCGTCEEGACYYSGCSGADAGKQPLPDGGSISNPDAGVPECASDKDCGSCGTCDEGVCYYYGCSGADAGTSPAHDGGIVSEPDAGIGCHSQIAYCSEPGPDGGEVSVETDLSADSANCGACGDHCKSGDYCSCGVCEKISSGGADGG